MLQNRRSEIAALQQKQAELEEAAATGQQQLVGLRQQRDQAAQNASISLAQVATLEERHRSAAAGLQRIESLVVEMRGAGGDAADGH